MLNGYLSQTVYGEMLTELGMWRCSNSSNNGWSVASKNYIDEPVEGKGGRENR